MDQHLPGRVVAVILAAGQSSRIGSTKQLLPLAGKPVLQHVIDNAFDSCVDGVVLVLGHDAASIQRPINVRNATVVVNPAYQSGQSGSLRMGLEAAGPEFDAAVVLQGDQPGITARIIDVVIDRWRQQGALIVAPRYEGKRGNPVLIDRSLCPQVMSISGDTGARAIFEEHASEIAFVDFDFPAPPDIDTMVDYLAVKDVMERQAR